MNFPSGRFAEGDLEETPPAEQRHALKTIDSTALAVRARIVWPIVMGEHWFAKRRRGKLSLAGATIVVYNGA
ncbi:hypothetical protein Pan216_48660 [Planctomycetes bacterium Pan216]|uniref:Uncharacterized protein n=1 Tax=Kolteria novifilia TaxID=2527975 RepID=A0A518BAH3_9BACT|nr:hypothetical protein Pan216_48660 [Planctomycetes bacterium Pan216]